MSTSKSNNVSKKQNSKPMVKKTEKTAPKVEKAKESPKEVKEKIPEKVVEEVLEEALVLENEVQNEDEKKKSEEMNISMEMSNFIEREKKYVTHIKENIKVITDMKKAYDRQMRNMKKNKKKKRDPNAPASDRKPSGFAKPTKISDALCDFFALDHGSMMARTDAAKKVCDYVRDNNLQNPQNRRFIILDAALEKLLGTPEERIETTKARKLEKPKTIISEDVGYFNIPLHLNKHFFKSVKKDKNESSGEVVAPSVSA